MSPLPAPPAPVARRLPVATELHGERRVDDYAWLRDKADPAVLAYLEAENAYADAVMEPTKPLQEALYREMLGRIQETDLSVPCRKDGHWYYSRTEEGKQYPIHCRKPGSLEAPEEVILDENALAEGLPFFDLGVFAVSDDARLLLYSTDVTGFREYTLFVRDLAAGRDLPFRIEKTGTVAWASDGCSFLYTVEDAAKRPYRAHRHVLGREQDELLFEERDELFRLAVGRSRSRALHFLVSGSHTTTEWRFRRADSPEEPWRVVSPRRQDHEYDVDHRGPSLYVRTNDRGRNFRLVTTPIESPGEENWIELVPHRPEVMLEGVELFASHVVLLEREDGLPHFRVLVPETGESHRVVFPEPVWDTHPGPNPEWETGAWRFHYESPLTPPSVFDHDLRTRASTLLKETPVVGGYDRTLYACERAHARARGGVAVPVDLVWRRDRPADGSAPAHLMGYGAYGIPLPAFFSSNRLSLLDRGFLLATAHVRGGGELGKPWHDDGRMLRKPNTFADFVACAEDLVGRGLVRPERLAIEGGSAGGLLMGAVVNRRPDLFRVVVSKVPFVDVLNTMSDPSLPLTAGEWEEWGDPRRKDHHDVIRSYCPYTNLRPGAYPAMLVKTSFHDSQVMYWEPAKYVARLRTLKTDSRVLLLKTNMAAGHGGASGRYDHLREVAFDYAFLLRELDLA